MPAKKKTSVEQEEGASQELVEESSAAEVIESEDLLADDAQQLDANDQTEISTENEVYAPESIDQQTDEQLDQRDYEKLLPPKNSCFWSCFFWSIIFFVVGVLFTAGFFVWRDATVELDPQPSISPIPSGEPIATNTPEPTPINVQDIDVSEVSLQVLNGSGIAGTAGDVATLLEQVGFSSIEVGNADSSNYEQTEVSIKSNVDDSVFDTIQEALVDYEVERAEELDGNNQYDVIIIVGRN